MGDSFYVGNKLEGRIKIVGLGLGSGVYRNVNRNVSIAGTVSLGLLVVSLFYLNLFFIVVSFLI